MKAEIEWLDEALASKDFVPAMTHYRVKDRMLTATNGRLVAGHPYNMDGEFLVPGVQLNAILKRLPADPEFQIVDGRLVLKSGRFRGSLQTLPPEEWRFREAAEMAWQPFPDELLPVLRDLRPFISENAVYRWSQGVCLSDGWCYATNSIVLAGAPFASAGMQSILPVWVVDFILSRTEGLREWAITEHTMAFRWQSGAWMQSTLIDDKFPEKASDMIRQTPKGSQPLNPDYCKAVTRITELSDVAVYVYADRVEGRTPLSVVSEALTSEVPKGAPCSIWSAKNLGLVMNAATAWSPSLWPEPVPFVGDRIRGFIAGRVG